MTITLNHTIVPARDKVASAEWFARIFGLQYAGTQGHFAPVQVNDTLTLDFDNAERFERHHYAFHVGDEEFDAIFGRITERGLEHWADPGHRQAGSINHNDGGRGVYWSDPDGHNLEIITRPYGSGAA